MRAISLCVILVIGLSAFARPVSFKDAVAITTLNQSFQTDNTVSYSFKRNAAIAARMIVFDDGNGRMNFFAPQLNFLLQRWNGENYQANLYSSGAVGVMNYNKLEHSAILTGIEGDAESRWLYFSGRFEKIWTGYGHDHWHALSRVGVAPYAADFDDLATWFMIQYEYSPRIESKYKVTPLIRLFYKNYLLEAGSSTDGDWMINFMVNI